VTITYFLGNGGTVTRQLTVGAGARRTVAVHGTSEGVGRGQAVSARVESTTGAGIVVERSMYFADGSGLTGGHTALGQ
jgi:hypothetical protein